MINLMACLYSTVLVSVVRVLLGYVFLAVFATITVQMPALKCCCKLCTGFAILGLWLVSFVVLVCLFVCLFVCCCQCHCHCHCCCR